MKKIKLLTALSGVAAIGAITPIMLTATSCNKTPTTTGTVELSAEVSALGVSVKTANIAKGKVSTIEFTVPGDQVISSISVQVGDLILKSESNGVNVWNNTITIESANMVADKVLIDTMTLSLSPLTTADHEYLTAINAIAKTYQSFGSPHVVVEATKQWGFDIFRHIWSNQAFELVYLGDNLQQFGILYRDNIFTNTQLNATIQKHQVWRFAGTDHFVFQGQGECEYSQYLLENSIEESQKQNIYITSGLDTGNYKDVRNVKFVGTGGTKNIDLRIFADNLVISNSNDNISHYSEVSNITVTGSGTGKTTYNEWGAVAYLKVEDAHLTLKASTTSHDIASVDVIEFVGDQVYLDEQAEDAIVYSNLTTQMPAEGSKAKIKIEYEVKEEDVKFITQPTDFQQYEQTSCILRLQNDITCTSHGSHHYLHISPSATGATNIVLDLNGHKIIDKITSQGDYWNLIEAKCSADATYGCSLTLMDSQAANSSNGEIQLNSHRMQFEGNGQYAAKFLLNSGKITGSFNTTNIRPGLIIGVEDFTGTEKSSNIANLSEFYMYGGEINIKHQGTIDGGRPSPAVKASSYGTYVYINNGIIHGDKGAIGTDDGSSHYQGTTPEATEGPEIKIVGGKFTAANDQFVISLTQQSKLDITNGYFEGGECIGAINSDVTINGGTFIANGSYIGGGHTTIYKSASGQHSSYLIPNGGVILSAWDKQSDIGVTRAPSFRVSNATMYSQNGYVFTAVTEPTPVQAGLEMSNIYFGSGSYSYGRDNGPRPGMSLEHERIPTEYEWTLFYEVTQTSDGTWQKHA